MGIVERRVDVDVEQTRGQLEALKENVRVYMSVCACVSVCMTKVKTHIRRPDQQASANMVRHRKAMPICHE